jgi:hypothetical protein
LLGKDDGWTEKNRMLAQALTIVEDETCSQCKTPLWYAYSTDNRVQFEIKEAFCYACAKLEQAREKDKKERQPGQIVYVKPYNVFENEQLPSRRELYAREAED